MGQEFIGTLHQHMPTNLMSLTFQRAQIYIDCDFARQEPLTRSKFSLLWLSLELSSLSGLESASILNGAAVKS